MQILADYHTHTVYSHGKGTIEDNVKEAISKGIKTIGISDHGYKHMTIRTYPPVPDRSLRMNTLRATTLKKLPHQS